LIRVGAALKRLNRGDMTAVIAVRVTIRRLREVLPVLHLESDPVSKVDTRLRKIARRLRPLQRIDALLAAADAVDEADDTKTQGEGRLKNELRRRRVKLAPPLVIRKATTELNKTLVRLGSIADDLIGTRESAVTTRARRWAIKARVARRAQELKRALSGAGAVYLPGRLRGLRRTANRVRLAAELLSELTTVVQATDLKTLEHATDVFERLRDTERLIGHLRRLQGALTPPDLKAWQELDDLIVALEHRCRRLHGRYVRDREALGLAADRLGARAAMSGSSKRKVS
jgi:CHAD domain-containing protein